jgi:hypothetical protein
MTIRHLLIGVCMFFLVGNPVGLWPLILVLPLLWWSSDEWAPVDWDREFEMIQ